MKDNRNEIINECQESIKERYETMIALYEGRIPYVPIGRGTEEDRNQAWYKQAIEDVINQLERLKIPPQESTK